MSGTPFYFDIHGHAPGVLPPILRLVPGNTLPPDFRLGDCPRAKLSGYILCVLGDPNSFRPFRVDPLKYALRALDKAAKAVRRAGGRLVLDAEGLRGASGDGVSAFILGVEGGDFLDGDAEKLHLVHERGARLIGLVHYARNALGSIAYGWRGRIPAPEEMSGLTDAGRRVIALAESLGMVVDLAHADENTAFAALEASTRPPICSHTGPRSLQDFPRYISDELLRELGQAGGLIGLWPFRSGPWGVPDLEAFSRFAERCAELAGCENLAIGSDINGVPGTMDGYRNPLDSSRLLESLRKRGFSETEIAGIAGGNFLRYFSSLTEPRA